MSDALENAFVLVIGQSCLLFGKLLIPIISGNLTNNTYYIILCFAIINITCITTNWVSCRQNSSLTTYFSFFIDALTLCVFFGITYIFNEYYKEISTSLSLLIVSLFYICIHVLFIVWNMIMMNKDMRYNFYLMNSNYMNIISILTYGLVGLFCYINEALSIFFFAIAVIYWFYFLAVYIHSLSIESIETYIIEATWFEFDKTILKQFWVSIKSYLTYPFAHFRNSGARRYFTKLYEGELQDELIFAGNRSSYFDIILPVLQRKKWTNIIDLGCGKAHLVQWLNENQILFDNYIGIDFAITEQQVGDCKLYCGNVENFSMDYSADNLVICVNTLCYLSDKQLDKLLNKLNYTDRVIVVEPQKGLFWDAYFSDVRIHYRSYSRLIKKFNENGFVPSMRSASYGINKFKYHHFIHLANCVNFQKKAPTMDENVS